MAKSKKVNVSKKSTNPLVFVGVGCLALIVLSALVGGLVAKFVAKKMSTGFLQTVIEKKTGVKTNLSDLEKGKMTFTDPKTGAKVDIGSGEIPATFPKDFPLYPGTKVLSSLSGKEAGQSNGFWLMLSTTDSADKVAAFYTTQLSANGWTVSSTFASGETTTATVTKGAWQGTYAITGANSKEDTQIVIILGQDDDASSSEMMQDSGY